LVVNIFYFALCLAWAVWVIIAQTTLMRMSRFFLLAIQTSIFIFCLLRLRELTIAVAKKQSRLSRFEKDNVISPNILLLNLSAYIYSIFTLGTEFSLLLVLKDSEGTADTEKTCRLNLASSWVYLLAQVSMGLRACISCYMNMRYSRPFEQTKKQFVQVFGSDEAYDVAYGTNLTSSNNEKQQFYKRKKIFDLIAEE